MEKPPHKKPRLDTEDNEEIKENNDVLIDSESTENDSQVIDLDTKENELSSLSSNKSDKKVTFDLSETRNERVIKETTDKEGQPRLIMKKMVLNNFKSYAGRQVIGPFHKSFSAIVGPNGSGKSNVIDALLFVFGYRANKMRQGKLSELIHNSSKHPNCTSCSVEIHFQEIVDGKGPNDMTVVPNSQLVISRQATKSNSSKYYINGKSSSFSEVTTLLKARGIDLDHKRFLILQGEVESIALMKAKAKDGNDDGLLEYLEDIIGTSKYKDPIEETNTRLEVLNEERTEKSNRLKYVSREKDGLEEKKAEAENYLDNENELTEKKNILYQIYIHEAKENIKVATESISELKGKLGEEADNYKQLEIEKDEINVIYKEEEKKFNSIEIDTNNLIKEQNRIEKDEVEIRERKEYLIQKQEKGKATLEMDRKIKTDAEQSIKKLSGDLVKWKKELTELEKQLKKEEAKVEKITRELQGKTDSYMAEIAEHQKKLAPWSEKINEKKKAIDVKKSECDLLAEKITSGEKAVLEAEKQLHKLSQSAIGKRKDYEALPKVIKELNMEIKELENFVKNITSKEVEKRNDWSNARQKADEARSSMQTAQIRGKVLSSILRMRDSGRIDGIYDRLGNLGVIDDQYDVAISTACPALDNIVVETVETAQACIEYLRKNNLGRAVFTVLSQLREQSMHEIDTPENVPRLFDLIQPKHDKFRPAFYSVLQDTLVATDLNQANTIAYGHKRWRVVTMDGKLIERSGAMTGGGSKQMRGAMSSIFVDNGVSAETVAELEKERDRVEKEYRNIVEEKRATEVALRRKKETLPLKEVSMEKLQMDLKSLEAQIEDEKKQIKKLEDQTQPKPADVQRQKDIKNEIEVLEEEMAGLKEMTSEIEETISSLQEDIMDAGGMDLRLQKVCVNDVRQRIDSLNNRITKSMVAQTKAEKDVIKHESSIAIFEKESEKFESNVKEIEEEERKNAEEMRDIVDRVDKAKELMEEKKANKEGLKKQLDEKNELIRKLHQSEMEIKNKIEEYERTLSDNQKKVSYWEELKSKLSLQRVRNETDEDLKLKEYTELVSKSLIDTKEAIKMEIAELEAFVQNAKPNLSVLDEYRRRQAEYDERKADLDSITSKRDEVKSEVETLRKKRLDEFMHGFNIISQKLKEMYQMITMGGNAELELVDSLDPFSEGIVFSVMPPKKSWKNISNLSGGEKTLSSLALVFALHHFKPTPLYVMDEIDAALDFRNVSIVANYIAERTKNAQFVIISLRNNMFELADRLVGIYKTSDCTRSIAINPNMIALLTATPTNAESSQKRNNSIPSSQQTNSQLQ